MTKRAFYLIVSFFTAHLCFAFPAPQTQTRLTDDNAKVTDYLFPLEEDIQSVVFTRNGLTWIIFDRPLLKEGEKLPASPLFENARVLPNRNNTILQLVLPPSLFPQVQKKGHLWIFSLTEKKENTQTLPLIPVKKEKGIYFKTQRTNPVEWRDPVTQERLIAFPLSLPEEHVSSTYSVPGLEILPTVQGIALAPRTAELHMEEDEDGFLLTAPTGLFENEKIPFEWEAEYDLLDFSIYGTFNEQDFFTEKNRLKALINNAPTAQKETFRTELARLYLSQNMPVEALEVLANTAEKDETLCLKAAALSLLNRNDEALEIFNQIKTTDITLYFWKNLVNPKKRLFALHVLKNNLPDQLKAALITKALRKAFRQNDLSAETTLMKIFGSSIKTPYQTQQYYFFSGLKAEKENRILEALSNYSAASEGPFSQTQLMAFFKKTVLELQTDSIKTAQAIHTLENLSVGLRNTEIEPELLRQLAQLYRTQNDYGQALRTYKTLLSITQDLNAPEEMTKLFSEALFQNKDVSPLERVAFFNEFKELLPNDQTGNDIMHLVVHDLISLDLLDDAYQISTALVEHRLQDKEQQVLTLEAALIALLNRKPQEALNALLLMKQPPLTAELSVQKAIIESAALKALNRPSTALPVSLLKSVKSPTYFHPALRTFFLEIKAQQAPLQ